MLVLVGPDALTTPGWSCGAPLQPAGLRLPCGCSRCAACAPARLPACLPAWPPQVMGIDFTFGKAYAKAAIAAGQRLPVSGNVFITMMDKYKDAGGWVRVSH